MICVRTWRSARRSIAPRMPHRRDGVGNVRGDVRCPVRVVSVAVDPEREIWSADVVASGESGEDSAVRVQSGDKELTRPSGRRDGATCDVAHSRPSHDRKQQQDGK